MQFDFKNSKIQIIFLTAAVYFIQGALGISAIAVPIFLRHLGWSIAEITMIASLASLPWILKIIYGFLSDSLPLFGYRRKSYLLLYLALSISGWCLLAFWGHDKPSILLALWIANLGFAGTDVITDGLVVENSEGEWGRIYQSIAWGFRSLGSVLTGILGGWLAVQLVPQAIFAMTACLPLLALFPLLLFHEVPHNKPGSIREWLGQLRIVGQFCIVPRNLFFICFFALSTSSVLFSTPFFFYMREKLFFPDDYLGFLISLGWAGAIIGSWAFARWMKQIPSRNLLYFVVILNALNILSTYAVTNVISAAWLIFVGGIAGGMTLLPLMAESAKLTTNTGVEGTLFALLMGLYNLSQIAWGFLGSKLLLIVSVNQLIGISTLIQLLAIFLIPLFCSPKKI